MDWLNVASYSAAGLLAWTVTAVTVGPAVGRHLARRVENETGEKEDGK